MKKDNMLIIGVLAVLFILVISGCQTNKLECPAPLSGAAVSDLSDSDMEKEELNEVEEESEKPTIDEKTGLPLKIVKEGELINFPNLAAKDPDGDELTYTFSEPLDENGTWQTEIGDAGEYTVTITASDGIDEISQDVFIIIESTNHAPEITPIRDFTVVQGDIITLTPIAKDEDGDEITFTFNKPFSKKGKWDIGYDVEGNFDIVVTANDGRDGIDSVEFTITVEKGNVPPTLTVTNELTVTEGDTINLEEHILYTDLDGDNITITFSGWMESSTYTTTTDDEGEYTVYVEANDGRATKTEKIKITVENKNQKPVFNPGAFS